LNERFGFIGYPLSIELLCKFNPYFSKLSEQEIKDTLLKIPPFRASEILGVKSKTGQSIIGDFILVMLLPDQILELDRSLVLQKITEAGKVAEALGDKIIGLGGLTSVIGNQGEVVAKNLNIAVTTGNTYTASTTIEAVLKVANLLKLDLNKAKVTIVGASGSIGSACSYVLSKKVSKLSLVARNQNRLKEFAESIKANSKAEILVSADIKKSVLESDIIIFATSSPNKLIDINDFKRGALVCDTSVPRNISKSNNRNDIVIIDGGLIKPPGNMYINFDIGLPSGYAYACLCETMILTLEKRFENYTIGSGLSLDKIDEIGSLANKHGFEVDRFKSFGQSLTNSKIIAANKYISKELVAA